MQVWGPFTAFRVPFGSDLFRTSNKWKEILLTNDYTHFDEWWGPFRDELGWETMGDVVTKLSEVRPHPLKTVPCSIFFGRNSERWVNADRARASCLPDANSYGRDGLAHSRSLSTARRALRVAYLGVASFINQFV